MTEQALIGHCSRCRKVWTLEIEQGVCRWCGELAICQTLKAKPRSLKTRTRTKPDRSIPDYQGLPTKWASYCEVAKTYENKVPLQDRQDIRHDIIIELYHAEHRDGKPLPLLRAYRIASLMVALYYRKQNRFSIRVCIFSGQPVEPRCRGCPNKSESKRCAWSAVRPVASLDGEILDSEGYRTRLLDTVATDKVLDLPDKWTELNEIRQGLPLRLVEIAYKRLEGKPLSGKDRKYLYRYRRQAQKSLF